MAQQPSFQIGNAIERINDVTRFILGNRIDRKIAPGQIFLQGYVGRREYFKPFITSGNFTFRSAQGLLFVRMRMQENRKILADWTITQPHHILGRRADHDIITICYRQSQQFIANRSAH